MEVKVSVHCVLYKLPSKYEVALFWALLFCVAGGVGGSGITGGLGNSGSFGGLIFVLIVFVFTAVVFVCILFVLLFAFIVYKFNGANTFIKGFMNSYIIWLVIAWYDALIIDCIFFCHSKKVRVPGTENMKEYEDYWFHIKGSIRGSIIGIPACALVGLLVIIL